MNLDELLGQTDVCLDILAPDELDRTQRFHFDHDRRRYAVGRGIVRRLVAGYLGLSDPRSVSIVYGPYGRPELSPEHGALRFNLAHTGGFALLAFARDVEIGVDVERVQALPDLHSVMRSCFAARERDIIAGLTSADQQHAAFFRCWTRKEAVLKALGSGLARPLDSFVIAIDEDASGVISMAGEPNAASDWQLRHLTPAEGFVGAAAWRGPAMTDASFTYAP